MWWLLALAVVAGIVAAVLVPRSRRRSEWEADLASTDGEVTWFARELLPQLQLAGTADALAGGWRVAALRVTALEDRLTRLETVAPDETSGARARQLRDAVRAARGGVEDLVASRDMTSGSGPAGVGRGAARGVAAAARRRRLTRADLHRRACSGIL